MKQSEDDFEGLIVEGISLEADIKKQKVNGKDKGNRTELNLCKLLTKHFGEDFVRSVGSGNRWSQANLSETAKQVYSGDICVPEGFKWVIECKGGYEDDMHLENVCDGSMSRLDEFMSQVTKDAEYCGRKPIILWKRNRKPWIAMIKGEDAPVMTHWSKGYIVYQGWLISSFNELLEETKKEFWFDE